ncbi:MAG: helicase-related protein, partial [Microcystaceae cyanobacterium]
QIKVKLSPQEKERYDHAIQLRNDFLRQRNIKLGSLDGWQQFVQMSASSPQGRRAMLAHREAKEISLGTESKLQILTDILTTHYPDPILIFTNDNATVYRISRYFFIPAITHQTPVKERHEILSYFRDGRYKTLVTSHVLNEGVDVPQVKIAVILSGTASTREYVQRLGRILRKPVGTHQLARLYEVVAEDTSEEQVAQRRKAASKSVRPSPQLPSQQLELLSVSEKRLPKAAEKPGVYHVEPPEA